MFSLRGTVTRVPELQASAERSEGNYGLVRVLVGVRALGSTPGAPRRHRFKTKNNKTKMMHP